MMLNFMSFFSTKFSIFRRPFVKRFALCYWSVVLSGCDVGVFWPNGWLDQEQTWHGGRPRPRAHCVRWRPSSPKEAQPPPIFGPCLLWPNGWVDQDATWYREVDLGPGDVVMDGDPALPPTWYRGRPRPRPRCVRWGPSTPRKGA